MRYFQETASYADTFYEMVDFLLLMLIAIQATVDVSREVKWNALAGAQRITHRGHNSLFLLTLSIVMLGAGKFYFSVTGLPTIGLIALYLLMLYEFMRSYPYIIVANEEAHICIHALQPSISLERNMILSVSKHLHLLRIEFQSEDIPKQNIVLDTRAFKNIEVFEEWLSVQKIPAAQEPPTQKAA